MPSSEIIEQVTYAIMRAYFECEADENGQRVFTVSPSDNEHFDSAAMEIIQKRTEASVV
jgi:hypothetical protein